MRRHIIVTAALAASAALAVAGCGGDDGGGTSSNGGGDTSTSALLPTLPEAQLDDDARFPVGSTVGDGLSAQAPPVSAAMTKAAKDAGCTVRGFPSEGRTHVQPEDAPDYGTAPPTSGNHFQVPAKWGVYDDPLPDMLAVHNLEHGGIVIYIGKDVPAAARTAIAELWAESPPFVVVAPGSSKGFPPRGVVVTSWQRWLVCKPFTAQKAAAVRAFRDEYRGTGPEQIAALHAPGSVGFPGEPEPVAEDPGAQQG